MTGTSETFRDVQATATSGTSVEILNCVFTIELQPQAMGTSYETSDFATAAEGTSRDVHGLF